MQEDLLTWFFSSVYATFVSQSFRLCATIFFPDAKKVFDCYWCDPVATPFLLFFLVRVILLSKKQCSYLWN